MKLLFVFLGRQTQNNCFHRSSTLFTHWCENLCIYLLTWVWNICTILITPCNSEEMKHKIKLINVLMCHSAFHLTGNCRKTSVLSLGAVYGICTEAGAKDGQITGVAGEWLNCEGGDESVKCLSSVVRKRKSNICSYTSNIIYFFTFIKQAPEVITGYTLKTFVSTLKVNSSSTCVISNAVFNVCDFGGSCAKRSRIYLLRVRCEWWSASTLLRYIGAEWDLICGALNIMNGLNSSFLMCAGFLEKQNKTIIKVWK